LYGVLYRKPEGELWKILRWNGDLIARGGIATVRKFDAYTCNYSHNGKGIPDFGNSNALIPPLKGG
jgi:hypothetical protein